MKFTVLPVIAVVATVCQLATALSPLSPPKLPGPPCHPPGSPGCPSKPPKAPRRSVTIRPSRDLHDDVSTEFLAGIKRANGGGTLHLKKNGRYIIGKKLDLSLLKDIEINIEGTLRFTDDITYWQNNNFYHPFQKSISFWRIGGEDITFTGGGTIDGAGQAWWNGFAGKEILDPSNTYLRPNLFYVENAARVSIEGLRFKDSPCWTTFMVNTTDISFNNVDISAVSNNASALPKNSDGFDTYNVDRFSVTNTRVNVGDDCFSPKPNTSNIYVNNLWCNGTHGVSMGSIGQYPGTLDYIRNVFISNVTLLSGTNGARLKGWAGPNVGYGEISNVTFKDFVIGNTDMPIVLDQCYFNVNACTCAAFPSRVNFTDITFDGFRGNSSGKYKDVVAELKCSPAAVCSGISLKNVHITDVSGKEGRTVCQNIQGDVGVNCTAP